MHLSGAEVVVGVTTANRRRTKEEEETRSPRSIDTCKVPYVPPLFVTSSSEGVTCGSANVAGAGSSCVHVHAARAPGVRVPLRAKAHASIGVAAKRMDLQSAAARIQQRFRQFMARRENSGGGPGSDGSGVARVGIAAQLAKGSSRVVKSVSGGGRVEDRAHPQTHSETSGDDDPEADEDRGETRSLCALGNVGGAGRGGKRRGAHRSAGNDYSPKSTPCSQQGASPIFSTKFLKCAMLTVSWFGLSTALALFNKQVFGRRHGGFPAPLFLTSVQFLIQFLLADFSLKYLAPSLMPKMPIPWGVYFTQARISSLLLYSIRK
jgi:hypothetical protein